MCICTHYYSLLDGSIPLFEHIFTVEKLFQLFFFLRGQKFHSNLFVLIDSASVPRVRRETWKSGWTVSMSLIVWIVWEGSRSLLDDPTWEPRETKKKKRWRSHSPSLVAPPQPPPPPPPDDISQTRTKSLSLFLFSEKLWGFIVDYVYSCIVKSSTSSQPASFHIERSLLYTHTEFSLVSGQDWNDVVRLPFLLLPLNLHHEHSRWLYSRHIQGPQL